MSVCNVARGRGDMFSRRNVPLLCWIGFFYKLPSQLNAECNGHGNIWIIEQHGVPVFV